MKKIYYLSTCSDCKRVIKELGGMKDFEQQDIKTEALTVAQLKKMRDLAGSYETLFSRRAIKYKEMKLKDKLLSEEDFKKLILEEYTFLRRPVVIVGDEIFIGHQEENVKAIEKLI